MSIQSLREERTAKAREYRNILDNNSGPLSDEVKTKLDELEAGITGIEDRITREQRVLDLEAEKVAVEAVAERTKTPTKDLFSKWLRNGDRGMTSDDWQTIRNTMSTTTPAEGGYTVATEVATYVMDAMKAFGGMRQVATILRTDQGNPMTWPTSDGTTEVGEILAENASATDLDVSFNTKNLPVYKYSSKVVTVPIELLQDSNVDIEAFVCARIAQRLGRITNTHFTTGDGSSKPTGIIAAASVGKTGTAGQTTTVTYADLVDLEHSVDPAYRVNCKWMFHDSTLKALKKDSGQPEPSAVVARHLGQRAGYHSRVHLPDQPGRCDNGRFCQVFFFSSTSAYPCLTAHSTTIAGKSYSPGGKLVTVSVSRLY